MASPRPSWPTGPPSASWSWRSRWSARPGRARESRRSRTPSTRTRDGSVALANSRGFAASYSATQAWAYASAFAGEGADLMTGLGVGMGRSPSRARPGGHRRRGGRARAGPGGRAPAGEPPLPGGPGRVRGGLLHRLHRLDAVGGRRPARPLAVRRPRGRGGGRPGAEARRRRHRQRGTGQRPVRRRGRADAPHRPDRGRPPARLPLRLAHRAQGRVARAPATPAAAPTARRRRWGPPT